MGNMGNLMKQAQKAMEQAQRMEADLAAMRVEGSSGGGMVRVECTGAGSIEAIHIDPQVVDPNDIEMLQDLILSALRDAQDRAAHAKDERLTSLKQSVGLPPGLF
jgi:DNA-binding YbaB/EbfC family protein